MDEVLKLTVRAGFWWFLKESDNNNCVQDFKFTSGKEVPFVNPLFLVVVAARVWLLPFW